jgi:hypothetical protein
MGVYEMAVGWSGGGADRVVHVRRLVRCYHGMRPNSFILLTISACLQALVIGLSLVPNSSLKWSVE